MERTLLPLLGRSLQGENASDQPRLRGGGGGSQPGALLRFVFVFSVWRYEPWWDGLFRFTDKVYLSTFLSEVHNHSRGSKNGGTIPTVALGGRERLSHQLCSTCIVRWSR